MQHWLDHIGKYQLVGEIARGGMGIVYLAVARGPKGFSKLLVLKELKPELVEDPVFLEMFLEEARLAARLNHPNIVHTYDVGAEGSRHYIVMDYLEGYTLARVLRKKSPKFTLNMHLRVLCEVLQGLHYAHTLADYDGTELGIVHRDSTPQNVFLTFDGQVKLVDFGIAKAIDSTIETRAGILKGKPAYMAPEQIGGDVDPRVDVFAIGVMIWEAVAGRRMWQSKSDVEVLGAILKGEVPELKESVPDAPEALCKIVERATAKHRDARYPTAAEMHTELEAYLGTVKATDTARDVGHLLAELFATERAAERSTIEAHLARVKEGETRSSLPSIRPPGSETMPTPSGRLPEESGPISKGELVSSPSSVGSLGRTPSGTEMPTQTPMLTIDPAARRKKTTFVAGAVGLAVAIALLASVVMKSNGSGNAGGAATVVAAPAPSPIIASPATQTNPATAETAREHTLSVTVVPANATLMIDGRTVTSPASRQCLHGESVLIHASKTGFSTKERELRCDADTTVALELDVQAVTYITAPAVPAATQIASKKPGAAPPETVAPTAPLPTAATAAPAGLTGKLPDSVSPIGGTKPNRPIDTSSPYGNQ